MRTILLFALPLSMLLAGCGGTDGSAYTDSDTDTDTDTDSPFTINNASFESTSIPSSGAWTTVDPPGWRLMQGGEGGLYRGGPEGLVQSEPLASPAHGLQAAYIRGVNGGDDLQHLGPILMESGDMGDGQPRWVLARVAVAKRLDRDLNGSGSAYVRFSQQMGPCETNDVSLEDLRTNEGTWLEAWMRCEFPPGAPIMLHVGALGMTGNRDEVLFDNVRVSFD